MSHLGEDEGSGSFLTSESSETELPECSPDGRYLRVILTQLHDLMNSFQNITIHRAVDREEGNEVSWVTIPLTMNPEHTDFFLQDLDQIAKLTHPNLMHCHTKWLDGDNTLVLITDLIPGNTLREHLKKIKKPRLKRVRIWAMQLLSALDYLHALNPPRVHGDLTPQKIYVVSRTGDLKVGGLGLGTCFRHHTVSRPVNEFTAPDSVEVQLNPNVDIYSLGMCLLEICTLEKPYKCCESVEEANQRASKGVLPLGLGRIEDLNIRTLIAQCITSKERRPSAAQLLTHPFFSLPIDEEKLNEPVKLRAVPAFESWEEPKISEIVTPSRKVNLCIAIVTKDSPEAQKVFFEFDVTSDTPQSIALEMVRDLGLPIEMKQEIAENIISQLGDAYKPKKGSEELAEKLSSPSEQSSSDSIEVSPRMPYIRRGRKFSRKEIGEEKKCLEMKKLRSSMQKQSPTTAMISTRIALDQINEEADVRVLQKALNLTLNVKYVVDGHYTFQTQELVSHYQDNIGLRVDGVVTPQLWGIILEHYENELHHLQANLAIQRDPSTRDSPDHLSSWEENVIKNPLDNY